jgi:hypothetical protein
MGGLGATWLEDGGLSKTKQVNLTSPRKMNRSVICLTNYEAHRFYKGGDLSTVTALKRAVQ